MKRPKFLKLREPDSGAGGAPPVADSSPTPAASAAPAADTSAAAAPAADAPAVVPDPNADPGAWESWWDNATDEQRTAWMENRDEPTADSSEPKQGEEKPAAEGEEKDAAASDAPAELTQEEFDKLPPAAKVALEQAQQLGQLYEEKRAFIEAEDSFKVIMADPVIAQRLAEMQHGIELPKWLDGEFNSDAMIEDFLGKGGKDLDFTLDPDGTKESLKELLKNVVSEVARRHEVKAQFEQAKAAETNRRTVFLERGFANLATKFAQLKSDKPIDSPEHPINSFREEVLQGLAEGVPFSFYEKEGQLERLLAGHLSGSVQNIVQKAETRVRTNFLGNIKKAAVNSAVTAAGAVTNAPPPPANPFGVDETRYLTDAGYQSEMFNRADELAAKGDMKLMNFLGSVRSRQR